MSFYAVSSSDGTTLVTTIINANDADDTDGNPLSLTKPKGFSVDRASQVCGPSNDTKAATQVLPTNPLPDKAPYSGEKRTATADADSEQNVLNIELAASSVTVFVMRKQ